MYRNQLFPLLLKKQLRISVSLKLITIPKITTANINVTTPFCIEIKNCNPLATSIPLT